MGSTKQRPITSIGTILAVTQCDNLTGWQPSSSPPCDCSIQHVSNGNCGMSRSYSESLCVIRVNLVWTSLGQIYLHCDLFTPVQRFWARPKSFPKETASKKLNRNIVISMKLWSKLNLKTRNLIEFFWGMWIPPSPAPIGSNRSRNNSHPHPSLEVWSTFLQVVDYNWDLMGPKVKEQLSLVIPIMDHSWYTYRSI